MQKFAKGETIVNKSQPSGGKFTVVKHIHGGIIVKGQGIRGRKRTLKTIDLPNYRIAGITRPYTSRKTTMSKPLPIVPVTDNTTKVMEIVQRIVSGEEAVQRDREELDALVNGS